MIFINNFKTALTREFTASDSSDIPISPEAADLLSGMEYVMLTLTSGDGSDVEIVMFEPGYGTTRGAEGTSPMYWPAGTIVFAAVTAEFLNSVENIMNQFGALASDVNALAGLPDLVGSKVSATTGSQSFPWTGAYDPQGFSSGDIYVSDTDGSIYIANQSIRYGNRIDAWVKVNPDVVTSDLGFYPGAESLLGGVRTIIVRSGQEFKSNISATMTSKVLSSDAVVVTASNVTLTPVSHDRSVRVYFVPSVDATKDPLTGIPSSSDMVIECRQLTLYPAT